MTHTKGLAVVKVPVADACGFQISSCTHQVSEYYDTLPYAPDTGSYGCQRIHQLLFNDVVTITKEYPGGEVSVEFKGLFFLDGLHRKRHDFWMLKKDLALLSSLPHKVRNALPPPVDCQKPVAEYSQNVLILKEPWFDEKTACLYSVGTRFSRTAEQDTESSYAVRIADIPKKKVLTTFISKKIATVYTGQTFEAAKKAFLSYIQEWAHPKKGFIPYVYGGSSMREFLNDPKFSRLSGMKCKATATFWDRPSAGTLVPRSGFDCSNMILCAAQMAFMPFYFKNTFTLMTYLRPLKLGEKLEEGDLIWYSGHVIMVSNVEKNLLIESIGYEAGYGRIHEIPLSKVFHGIQTFDQLIHTHLSRQFLYRLDSTGGSWRSVYRLKILKLSSLLNYTI
jgi:hypothetical protein